MVIWLILASIPVLASLVIAWRIYANFQPQQYFKLSAPRLFLLTDPQQFSIKQVINYPYQTEGLNWSIEWLIKGNKPSLVLHVPIEFIYSAKLTAIEIEDYSQQLNSEITEIHQFQWAAQEVHKISIGLIDQLFKHLQLTDQEKIGWQLSFNNHQLKESVINCRLLLMVTAKEMSRRRQLVVQIEEYLSQHSPLYNAHTQPNLNDYQQRFMTSDQMQLKREQFMTLADNKFS